MKVISLLLAALGIQGATLTIRNVNVVDVETGSIRPKVNVVINGQTVTAVGTARTAGPSIDGTGKYLIPGLWDMHVHLWEKKPMFGLYVANGVLGVRDMGSTMPVTLGWRLEADAGRVIGPRIYTAGTPMDGPAADSRKLSVVQVRTPEEARRAVDTIDGQRADFIMVMSGLSRDAYFSLAQRCRVIRAVFAGHVPESVSVWQAIDARQRSMEHLFGIPLACSSEESELREARTEAIASNDTAALARIRARTYETFSESRATELFKRMARFDVWQTPTLTFRKRLSLMGLDELATDSHLKEVPSDVAKTWSDPRKDLEKSTPEELDRFKQDYEFHQNIVALMQRNGVGLLAGTDTGDPYVLPGYSLHEELELFVKAGLTPAQALRTATIHPAQYFRIEPLAGSIARGKRADLVLLEANPLDDIRNTRRIAAVVLRGRLLQRKDLDKLLK